MKLGILFLLLPTILSAHKMDSTIAFAPVKITSHFNTPFNSKNELQNNSNIYIKNYGDGQLSSISYRGFSAQQTQIRWNNVDISSPFLGQIDLSTIPFSLNFNQNSNANIGGLVNIQTNIPDNGDGNTHKFYSSLRSQNLYQFKYNFTSQKQNNAILVDIDSKFGKNDFSYIDYNNREARLTQNEVIQNSVYLGYRFNKKSFALWFNQTDRNIAPNLSSLSSSQHQKDNSLRLLYDHFYHKGNHKVVFFIDNLIYRDTTASIYSRSANYSVRNKLTYIFSVFKHHLYSNLETNFDVLNSSNFIENQFLFKQYSELYFQENIKNTHMHFQTGITHTWYNLKLALPLPFFNIKYISSKPNLFIREVALKSRIQNRFPTGNDLYWPIGGNSTLKPEYSFQLESNLSLGLLNQKLLLDFNPFVYYTQDLIQWKPNSNGTWSVENNKSVWSRGLSIQMLIALKHFKISNQYQLNYATNSGQQLIYAPLHKLVSQVEWVNPIVNFKISNNFTSERFITNDNSQSIPAYDIIHLDMNKTFEWKSITTALFFGVNNLTNVNYVEIANRAMPLRMFQFKILVEWKR